MRARALLVAALLFGAASCRSAAPQTADGGGATDGGLLDLTTLLTSCSNRRSTHVRGLIGPDVDVRIPCTTGSALWSISLTGDQVFGPRSSTFVACQSNSPLLATAVLGLPDTVGPGATFDAVATVSAEDGSFPTGQVNLHAEVVSPTFTLDRTSIDFGDVLPDQSVSAAATAISEFAQAPAAPASISSGFFHFDPTKGGSIAIAKVRFAAHAPGDYTATWVWTAGLFLAPGCTTTKTIALHARVIAPDGGAIDGGDASADGD